VNSWVQGLTAVGVILTAVVALRNGWRANDTKTQISDVATKVDEVHALANSALDTANDRADVAEARNAELEETADQPIGPPPPG
jgi:hypothetical protein